MRIVLAVAGAVFLFLFIADQAARQVSQAINNGLNTTAFTASESAGGLLYPSAIPVVGVLAIVCLVAAVVITPPKGW